MRTKNTQNSQNFIPPIFLFGLSSVAPGLLAAPVSRQETTILGHQKGRTGSVKSWMVFGVMVWLIKSLPQTSIGSNGRLLGIIVQLERSGGFCSCSLHTMVVPTSEKGTQRFFCFKTVDAFLEHTRPHDSL